MSIYKKKLCNIVYLKSISIKNNCSCKQNFICENNLYKKIIII